MKKLTKVNSLPNFTPSMQGWAWLPETENFMQFRNTNVPQQITEFTKNRRNNTTKIFVLNYYSFIHSFILGLMCLSASSISSACWCTAVSTAPLHSISKTVVRPSPMSLADSIFDLQVSSVNSKRFSSPGLQAQRTQRIRDFLTMRYINSLLLYLLTYLLTYGSQKHLMPIGPKTLHIHKNRQQNHAI